LIAERPDVWAHDYSQDWLCWRCPQCDRIGGMAYWWHMEDWPLCPSCGSRLEEHHQADPDTTLHAIGRYIEGMLQSYWPPIGPGP
jgi:hypothetical protein